MTDMTAFEVNSMTPERRATAAAGLVLAGASLAEVRRQLGYATMTSTRSAVRRGMARALDPDDLTKARDLELARLDRLWRALWPAALDENHADHRWATQRVLQVSQARRALLGLDAPRQIEVHVPTEAAIEEWIGAMAGSANPPLPVEADVIEGELL
jgi:hypothetical protein